MKLGFVRRLAAAMVVLLLVSALLPLTAVVAQDGDDVEELQVGDPQARQRIDQALGHLSGFLELETTITLERIEADSEDIPFVSYSWLPVTYTTSALGCPAAGTEYTRREVPAYRIRLTVYGYGTYSYRVSEDGRAVILCLGGRPSDTSIGLELASGNSLGTAPSRTGAAPGLVGGPARVDQAMRHVSDYLGLLNTITLERVTSNYPYIAYTEYGWVPQWLTLRDGQCPSASSEYATGRVYGYEIILNVNGRDYTYYANEAGTLLVLCINGRPSRTSIGLE